MSSRFICFILGIGTMYAISTENRLGVIGGVVLSAFFIRVEVEL